LRVEHELTILSPEKTILTYPLASIGRRICAQFIDILVLFGIWMLIGFLMGPLSAIVDPSSIIYFQAFLQILAPFAYFILCEGLWNGRTVGKLACGLRVKMADGTPIRFSSSVGRNLIRVGDFFPVFYFAGLLATFTNARAQRLGDLVANTVVVRDAKAIPRFSPAPHKAGVHPFEAYVGELRGMTDEEYIVLKRFCDRFPELAPHVQQHLVDEIWVPFAAQKHIASIDNVHPLYLAEATVMKYGRIRGLL
jgi:uncharacterized RDD family membrane protein YckC